MAPTSTPCNSHILSVQDKVGNVMITSAQNTYMLRALADELKLDSLTRLDAALVRCAQIAKRYGKVVEQHLELRRGVHERCVARRVKVLTI